MKGKSIIFGSGVSSFKDFKGLTKVCEAALSNDILSFDTAPSYHTEDTLTKALFTVCNTHGLKREDIYIQTKIDPIQMYKGNITEYFKNKLRSMRLDYVDGLLVHWPVFNYLDKTWEELESLKETGYAKEIGICNLRIQHLEELKDKKPDILQIERHPLNTFERETEFARNNGIKLQDYSPLCKMHPIIKKSEVIKKLSAKYKVSEGLLTLRWHLDTGGIPIFTSKKPERIKEYSNIDKISLSPEECNMISQLNINHKLYIESLVCPGF